MSAHRSRASMHRAALLPMSLALAWLALAGRVVPALSQPDPFWKPGSPTAPATPTTPPASPNPATPRGPAQPQRQAAPAPPPAPPASPVIARVNGRPITQLDYDRVAQPYFQNLRSQFGDQFGGEMRQIASFNVLDELVRREVVAIEAQRLKLEPTQAEIDAILMPDPSFHTNGRFDPALLAAFKASPTSNYLQVLPRLRELAAMRKLDETLRRRFTPTAAQIRAEWGKRSDQVRFKVLPLLTRDMPLEPEASPAECAQYYQAHTDQFVRKAKLRLRYLRLPLPVGGDSTRAGAEAEARTHALAIADSLRAGTLADSGARFIDSGLFDIPAVAVPGLGRLAALTDTLTLAEADTSIRVLGPYTVRDVVVVGVVAARMPKVVPSLAEVMVEAKRRAEAEKRRISGEADRLAHYEAHRDHWKSPRVTVTRVRPTRVDLPAADMGRWLAALRKPRDPRALSKLQGVVAETLSFTRQTPPDTLFGAGFVDSLLAGGPVTAGSVQGPRRFGFTWVAWRIDAVDTSYVPAYGLVRSQVEQEFAEAQRQKDLAEARAYFDQHRADYKSPEKFALDYVAVPLASTDSILVPEADLRREYDANPTRFRRDDEVKARHILFMTRGASAEVDRQARARADSLLAAIRTSGGDFAELAKRFSQEPGASTSGGDLGWFGRGRMVKEFEEAAFAMEPGETSPVVKTQFGYHIIRLEDRHAAGPKPFEEVRDGLRLQLAQARADSNASRAAGELRRRLAAGGNAAELATGYGGVIALAPIAATDPLPALGVLPGLAADLPSVTPGTWAAKTYRSASTYVVLRVREKLPPRPAEFDEARAQAVEDMNNAKRREVLARKVAEMRAALAAGASLDSLAGLNGGLKDSGLQGRGAVFVPAVGGDPRVVEHAFGMKSGDVSDTLQVASGVAWLRVEERKTGDAAAFRAMSPQIEAELMRKGYDAWMEQKRKSLRVEILRADLKGPRPAGMRAG